MSGEGKVVCVTGASGYIASWLVKLLLRHRYTVKATVRDPNDAKKTEHLRALDGANERLVLLKANLLEKGSFDDIVVGCECVFHTASPVLLSTNDPQSCAKVASIKRVILTSSIAAVFFNGKPLTPDAIVDETWYSDPSYCESKKFWYVVSKTLAEEAAWKFAKENGIDMITINPGFVIGPLLQPTVNLSVEEFAKYYNGAETYPNCTYRFVDVRDVAYAHVRAFEVPSASGRYCMVNKVAHFTEVVKIVREKFPTMHLPEKPAGGGILGSTPEYYSVSNEKAKTLGIDFTPLEVSVVDTIESLKEKGFLKI